MQQVTQLCNVFLGWKTRTAWIGAAFVFFFRLLVSIITRFCCRIALLASLDYLLNVATTTHTFNNARFRADFPDIAKGEESMVDAFRRIHRRQKGLKKDKDA